jgi:hypothetical protein
MFQFDIPLTPSGAQAVADFAFGQQRNNSDSSPKYFDG